MKLLKLVFISMFMFVFALACQAGQDNRTVYESDTSDGYSQSLPDEDKEDHEGHDHDTEIIEALSQIEAIVDPENLSWPRKIVINEKEISITERPDKVLTISLGHDEILFGISNKDQIVGTTSFAQEEGMKSQAGMFSLVTDQEVVTRQVLGESS